MRLAVLFLSSLGIVTALSSATLTSPGVLGNSGEQGAGLVRFGTKSAAGLGAVYDAHGTIWDRGGDGVLNRYSLDGRQLASFPLRPSSPGTTDTIALAGDVLLLSVAGELYTLPCDAPSGTPPASLDIKVAFLSPSTRDGWAAAVQGREVFLVNARAEKRAVGRLDSPTVYGVEIDSAGAVYVQLDGRRLRRFATDGTTSEITGEVPGTRPQLIGDHWFGYRGHSTIRRADRALQPAPGVILGGNSGAFIGYVDEYSEIHEARGLAPINQTLFAVSGYRGVMHLLEWLPAESRMQVLRRIGAVPVCDGLGLDADGRVWFGAAHWEWSAGPASPMRPGIPHPDEVQASTMTDDDVLIAYGRLWRKPAFWFGKIAPRVSAHRIESKTILPAEAVALAVTPYQQRRAVLVLAADGRCAAAFIAGDGRYQGDAGAVVLKTKSPVKAWTSLIAVGKDRLLGAADGQVIELVRDGNDWTETLRWNGWGARPPETFGNRVHIALDGDVLWISDTARQRVVCLDRATRRLLATFGQPDVAGDTLALLNQPALIVARNNRGLVFDSVNQRLIKLELTLP
jgi:sugar lactone lactonase YvrE